MLELSVYEDIPHLLHPVVTEPRKAVFALKWAVREMNERYKQMSSLGVRNIDSYNNIISKKQNKKETILKKVQIGFDSSTGKPIYQDKEIELTFLPFLIIVVDEMADLMLAAGKEIEVSVQALAQKARAAGIHLVLATQRPSVDVITGTIKANLPYRISFQVTSKIDSRTILGEQGAEQLLGKGDMLFMAGGGFTERVHGPLVNDKEIAKITNFIKGQGIPEYQHHITEDINNSNGEENNKDEENDPLYEKALALIIKEKKVSTSFLQRHFAIGYNRAARIVDIFEKKGIVSAANSMGRREVLIDRND
jgi:S-DNA-T family DNA segregation ATPase FtsK/SpoIIIE